MNTQQMDQKQDITTALETRYLLYAVSTIMDRALPDARDGLKPVHRRILYAMNQLRLYPQSNFRKCSKIVGEVMGNYHPHGDKAIYDALARFAQDFSVRYPLIEGQGILEILMEIIPQLKDIPRLSYRNTLLIFFKVWMRILWILRKPMIAQAMSQVCFQQAFLIF